MNPRKLFFVLAAAALLLLQFADCMSAMTEDQQGMQCCASMSCDPSNQSHDCCKSIVSPQSSNVLPAAPITLHAPATVVVDSLPSRQLTQWFHSPRAQFEAPQHSPPDLYTLHASLQIGRAHV